MIVFRYFRFSSMITSCGLTLTLVTGCASQKAGGPVLTLRFPTATTLRSAAHSKSDVSTLSFDWASVCYIVNVTGPGVSESKANACEIPTGVFKGSVPPGGSVELVVPRGANRRLEVFIYRRLATGDTCPALQNGFGSTDRSRISRVAVVENILIDGDRQVDVDVKVPTPADSLISQYSLAANCGPTTPFMGLKKISQGRTMQSGSSLAIEGGVSSAPSEFVSAGPTLKIRANTRGN